MSKNELLDHFVSSSSPQSEDEVIKLAEEVSTRKSDNGDEFFILKTDHIPNGFHYSFKIFEVCTRSSSSCRVYF